jgi:hypothetical protein
LLNQICNLLFVAGNSKIGNGPSCLLLGLKFTLRRKKNVLSFIYERDRGREVSISPAFYAQLWRQNPFAKKISDQFVST